MKALNMGLALILCGGLSLAGCVSAKKLEQANTQITALNEQVSSLNNQTNALRQQVSQSDQAIAQLKTENKQYGDEARDCRVAKEAVLKNLQALNAQLEAKGTSIHKLRQEVQASVQELEDMGSELYVHQGRIHLMVPEQYVFASGSASIGSAGHKALGIIANVLNHYPNLETVVVGHTDAVPYKGSAYKDNWGLSTERANAVVRLLTTKYQVNPNRLIAAGRAQYDPISANELASGRAMNRRIEFVLTPDLSTLWEVAAQE